MACLSPLTIKRKTMHPIPHNTVLIVIDVQQAFDNPRWGERNNPGAEAAIAALLAHWRGARRPLIHVHHRSASPDGLFHQDRPGFQVKPEALPLPGETVLYKSVNSSFIGTELEAMLRAQGAEALVLVGITTDHCVSTTARMAGNLGFKTYVVEDATATFERRGPNGRHFSAQDMHDTALASLHGEFATVLDSGALLGAI
jgi:nicotinamidase-related amidase